jgi:hypothetical protein
MKKNPKEKNCVTMPNPLFIKAGMVGVEVMPQNKNFFQIEELQKIVGGHIQIIYLKKYIDSNGNPLALICNENGKHEDLITNYHATLIWEANYGKTDVMVGDILITPQKFLN